MNISEKRIQALLTFLEYDDIELTSDYKNPDNHQVYEYEAELDCTYEVQVFIKEKEIVVQDRPYDEDLYVVKAVVYKTNDGFQIKNY